MLCEEAGEAKAAESPATATDKRAMAQSDLVNARAWSDLCWMRRCVLGGGCHCA